MGWGIHSRLVREKTKPSENQRVESVRAVWTGFEPATSCVTGRHSNQLNYQTFKTGCKYRTVARFCKLSPTDFPDLFVLYTAFRSKPRDT
jgi:hypothetical protein